MELMKTPYQAKRRTLSVVSPHCKSPTGSVVVDLDISKIVRPLLTLLKSAINNVNELTLIFR